jgi:hypothetical protein
VLGSVQREEEVPTFETPWDWWISLSNLTEWLHWPAISALVAGMAWWRTGSLANRANRRDERKDVMFVMVSAKKLETAVVTYEIYLRHVDKGVIHLRQVGFVNPYNEKRGYFDEVIKVDIEKFTSMPAYATFLSGRHALQILHSRFTLAMEYNVLPEAAELQGCVNDCRAAIETLRAQAKKLSSANDWARLHQLTPPYSWAGFLQSLKPLRSRLRGALAGLLRPWRRRPASARPNA